MDFRLILVYVMFALLIIVVVTMLINIKIRDRKIDLAKDTIFALGKQLDESKTKFNRLHNDYIFNTRPSNMPRLEEINLQFNIIEKNKKIKELEEEIKRWQMTPVPCCEPDKTNLYECICGSTDFVDLKETDNFGENNVQPHILVETQCLKCGKIHSIKKKPYCGYHTKENIIKKEG